MHPGEHLMDKTKQFLLSTVELLPSTDLPPLFQWTTKDTIDVCSSCPAGKAKTQPTPKVAETLVGALTHRGKDVF